MNATWGARWRFWCFPPPGHRVVERRRGAGPRYIPFLLWAYFLPLSLCTWRLLVLGVVGVMIPLGMLLLGFRHAGAGLGFAALSTIGAGVVAAWWWRPRLRVELDLPARVPNRQRFSSRYRLTNAGQRAAYDVAVESLPFPHLFELSMKGAACAYLPPNQSCYVRGTGMARRRGRYRLQPFRWDTDFPLGLWRCGQTCWSSRYLNVYPAYTPLQHVAIPMGARRRTDTHPAQRLARSALEFHGCREFRSGDTVRHLHPRSSARIGVPVVKEFQAEGYGRTAVVVDTMTRWPEMALQFRPDPVVEAALSLAAAIVDFLAREDRVLELLVAGPGCYRFESAGRMGFFEEALDILAAVEPVRRDPLPDLCATVSDEIQAIQSVCLVLTRWDRFRADWVETLQAAQVGGCPILIRPRAGQRPENMPTSVISLSAQSIRQGEVTRIEEGGG